MRARVVGLGVVLLAAVAFEYGAAQPTNSHQVTKTQYDRWKTELSNWGRLGDDDAIKMLRDTIATLDALDAALSLAEVDPLAVGAISDQTRVACETCHAVYRDQDPDTDAYRLKPGSV